MLHFVRRIRWRMECNSRPVPPGAGIIPAELLHQSLSNREWSVMTHNKEDALRDAVVDLTDHLGIPSDKITLKSIEEVTWPDTSLGCPEEGMMYAQVLTPGFRIEIEALGKRYVYHSGGGRTILCRKPV